MPRIFEQPNNPTPDNTKNIAFGKVGAITENMTIAQLMTYIEANITISIPSVILEIGDWDMSLTNSITLAHGITSGKTKIRSATAVIRSDADALNSNILEQRDLGSYIDWDDTNVILNRELAGFFDSPGYNQTAFNRGWVFIEYVL